MEHQQNEINSLALVSALTHVVIKIHLNLQNELELLAGHKRGQRAVDLLARIHSLPVVLVLQVHFVAAGRLLVVVPSAWTLLCKQGGHFDGCCVDGATEAPDALRARCLLLKRTGWATPTTSSMSSYPLSKRNLSSLTAAKTV